MLLETAVPYFSEPAEEDCSGQGIARFAFIEADLNPAAQFDALEPGQYEQGSFDAAQLSQGSQQTTVVVEFDSYEIALAAYGSPDYKKALAALGPEVVRDFRIVEGA